MKGNKGIGLGEVFTHQYLFHHYRRKKIQQSRITYHDLREQWLCFLIRPHWWFPQSRQVKIRKDLNQGVLVNEIHLNSVHQPRTFDLIRNMFQVTGDRRTMYADALIEIGLRHLEILRCLLQDPNPRFQDMAFEIFNHIAEVDAGFYHEAVRASKGRMTIAELKIMFRPYWNQVSEIETIQSLYTAYDWIAIIAAKASGNLNMLVADILMTVHDVPRLKPRREIVTILAKLPSLLAVDVLTMDFEKRDSALQLEIVRGLYMLEDVKVRKMLINGLRLEPAVAKLCLEGLGRQVDKSLIADLITVLYRLHFQLTPLAAGMLVQIGVPAIPAVLPLLGHPDKNLRITAGEILSQIGPDITPHILPLLIKTDERIQKMAIKIVGRLRLHLAIPHLVQLLIEGDDTVSNLASKALGRMGTSAIQPLLGVLQHKSYQVRILAVNALGDLKDLQVVSILMESLHDRSQLVAAVAAEKLGGIGGAQIQKTLLHALFQTPPHVQQAIILALGQMKAYSAIHMLLPMLKHHDLKVTRAVLWTLGELGDPIAVPALIQFMHEADDMIYPDVTNALARIGSEEALEALKHEIRLQEPDFVAWPTVNAKVFRSKR